MPIGLAILLVWWIASTTILTFYLWKNQWRDGLVLWICSFLGVLFLNSNEVIYPIISVIILIVWSFIYSIKKKK